MVKLDLKKIPKNTKKKKKNVFFNRKQYFKENRFLLVFGRAKYNYPLNDL